VNNDMPESTTHPRWLNSTVIGIGLASLCSDVGHEMATTAMPALLATLGAGSATLGLIEGLADGLSSAAKLFSGLYSDRLARRKPLAVVGYFVTASAMASFALATQWWHVFLARVAGWIGRGARTPVRNVLLTEATTPETYGRAFGLERAMDSAGAVIGPLLAMGLISAVGMRMTFALTLLPGIAAALLIGWLVTERPHAPKSKARLWGSIKELPREFKAYLVGIGVGGVGDFANTLLILWATQAWTPRMGAIQAAQLAILYYAGYNVVYMISCYVSGVLADRFPKHRVLAIGYSFAIVPAVALLVPGDSLVKFAVVFGFSGV
jgi:MFS family permease